ncbi:HNH endonuclease [Streptosporangium sp. NBC_01755]|uniref:HNH endonuclease n=1 Tax=Streptosporangium sp. NBC_01755 TaxID=2975949 RepID=UPI002DD9F6AB|nr:HNH endonuclease [Streptosporangium sp. NBC_01755]WSD02103.1 HNH endonuclease [Streptosporangium sp. NBC_01755]
MKTYVGVTDGEWHHFLAARPALTEANFWRPSGGGFKALRSGEPFFFKTHHPHNRVVGGGFFNGFERLRISEAWDIFREANGATSLQQMRTRVSRYRKQPIAPGEDPIIGCVLLRDTCFFPLDAPAEQPPDFAPNLVQGKSYDLASHPQADYFRELLPRLLGAVVEIDLSRPWHRDGPTYGDPRLTPQRLGQQAFQAVVLNAYDRRCAITGDKIRPVLQAAHIRPLSAGGEHRLDNGLLLRSDIHTLFDRGYLAVDPEYRLRVSPRLREEFGNGEQFYRRAGSQIAVPQHRHDRPAHETLEWHLDEVFLAS